MHPVWNRYQLTNHKTKIEMSKICQITGKKGWIELKISAAGLRLINKVGLDTALKQAVSKGYVDWKDIKVIGD